MTIALRRDLVYVRTPTFDSEGMAILGPRSCDSIGGGWDLQTVQIVLHIQNNYKHRQHASYKFHDRQAGTDSGIQTHIEHRGSF